MQIKQPDVYVYTKWEKKKGNRYEQPIKYCNNTELTVDKIKNFKDVFGIEYSDALKESSAYNNTLKDCSYHSEFWNNDKAKEKAFNKIYEFNISGKSGTGTSTTPLLPFEIFMLNDGFEMISFKELNAYHPMGRDYKKKDLAVYLGFGIQTSKVKANFYFQTSRQKGIYQVDNSVENYKKAINEELESLI